MDERLFAQLAAWLADEAVVVASVLDTRGATPRKRGARMLIGATRTALSVGGGAAEARVVVAARALLATPDHHARVRIDLTGRADSQGVCGGTMDVALRRWDGAADRVRAGALAAELAAGRVVELEPADLGADARERAAPNARLLIVGGGHCAAALYDLARHLDYDVWVYDEREDCFASDQFDGATRLAGAHAALAHALDTARPVYAVLLNRDFPSDVATLAVLAQRAPAFIGMMGSAKRIGEVRAGLPREVAARLATLKAPVGLDLGAETPHEIAVSILAELIQLRRGL